MRDGEGIGGKGQEDAAEEEKKNQASGEEEKIKLEPTEGRRAGGRR